MKKSRKRLVGTAVALSSLALLLTGCSSGTSNTTASNSASASGDQGPIDAAHSVGAMDNYAVGTTFKASEPIDISLLYRDHPNYPVKDSWMIFQQLQANQNVTFTRTEIPLSDWQTKRGLVITGGDAPELMPVFYTGEETQYVSSGALLPISDYVQYMPNFEKILNDWGLSDYLDTKRQSDGKYYLLPGLMQTAKQQYSIIVRDDAWKAAGITSDPQTMDDLQADLQKLKTLGTCGVPLSAANNASDILQAFSPGYNTAMGAWALQGSGVVWDSTQNKHVYAGEQDGYKQLVQYMANLVSSGLMDPESLTQSTSDNSAAEAKFASSQSCAITGNDQNAITYQQDLVNAGVNTTVHMLMIPDGPFGGYIPGGARFSSGMIFSAKLADDPHFKAILQFVDWLYFSEQGIEFAQWGVQCPTGVTDSTQCTYTKDASGNRTLLPDIRNSQGLGDPNAPKLLNTDYGFSNGVFWPANGTYNDLMMSYYSKMEQDFMNSMSNKKELATPPATPMDADTLETVGNMYNSLKDITQQNLVQFILGQKSMSDWDSYVSQLQSASVDQYVQLYNDNVKQ